MGRIMQLGLWRSLGFVLAFVAVAGLSQATPIADPIQLDTGKISGAVADEAAGVRAYKGVPFAAPPVGDLRWKDPQPPAAWEGVKECVAFGKAPVQPAGLGIRPAQSSEDCLYLNVWTPAKDSADKLPVMVWIYGGAYYMGSGANYDGTNLAKQGVIVLTINYRLGPFGFFAHPALTQESGRNASGNQGLMDQIESLKWVKRNIAAFGGDPEKVTIFGESAGSGSVSALIVSPLTKGLFQRAIMESGSVMGQIQHHSESWYGMEPAETMGARIVKEAGIEDGLSQLKDMRAMDAWEFLRVANPQTIPPGAPAGNRFAPIVDGYVIPDDPLDIVAAGKQQKVPVIAGSNADEGMMFVNRYPDRTAPAFAEIMKTLYGDKAEAVAKFYPVENNNATQALNKHMAQSRFTAGARRVAVGQEKLGEKAYVYLFTHVRAGQEANGANHASEINYVFDRIAPAGRGARASSPVEGGSADGGNVDQKLAKSMSAYWVNFAKTGNPNGAGLPEWPVYTAAGDAFMEFANEPKPTKGMFTDRLNLFDEITKEKHAGRSAK